MPHSDDYGTDDDDTAFLEAATQFEASQHAAFESSNRPTKRRRIRGGPSQRNGECSQEAEWSETDSEVHCLPTQQPASREQTDLQEIDHEFEEDLDDLPGEGEGEEERVEVAKPPKHRIHIPNEGGQFPDQIFSQTQVDLDSSPGQFRGAIWKRPNKPPPPAPVFGQRPVTNGTAGQGFYGRGPAGPAAHRQTTLNGFRPPPAPPTKNTYQSDADLAARLQAEENAAHRQQSTLGATSSNELCPELADLPSDAFSSSPDESSTRPIIDISSQQGPSQARPQAWRGPQNGLKQMTIFGQPATQPMSATQAASKKHAWPLMSKDEAPTHHNLDQKAMETWVFPTNLGKIRDYQYNIVNRSLFHNTLVALPTGLGKTFIAATIMLNYYRWTTNAQIIFMAPTKPLIAQQMEACYNIVGIPRHDTVLMTGESQPAIRAEEWLTKRVFFMTPQTVINDLKTGICDPKKVVLVVVDEAHKATNGYAYTEVVKFLRRFNTSFRISALTATPGSTVESVQAVMDHLGIARVELRTEESLDIRPYTHEKHIDEEIFSYSEEQTLIMGLLSKAIKPVQEKLCQQNAYYSRDPMQLTAHGMNMARQKWMNSDAGRKAAHPIKAMVNSIITVLAKLGHSINLLKFHGIAPFHGSISTFEKDVLSGEVRGKYGPMITQSEDFIKMMRLIKGWTNDPDFIGHPKLQYLRQVVLNHFLDTGEGRQGPDVPPSATRVMVFASYRDSTDEICRVLKRNEPMIRPHVFVGQTASKNSEGMNQKKQNEIIQEFKKGTYNTLVATSIGEEGLDIGDVDLIVNYDASTSPIRMLQRIGRTGRKRVGRVVLLLMEQKEKADYAKAQDNYSWIQKSIADETKYTYHFDLSPRILPKDVKPVVDKRMIEIPVENSQPIDLNEKSRRARGKAKLKRPPKKFFMPDGVKTGFVKASRMDESDESDGVEVAVVKKKASAKKKEPVTQKKKALIEPLLEPAQLPFLEDVLLTELQEQELAVRYANAPDDGRDVVLAPDPAKHVESLRTLGTTKYMPHGRAALTIQKALVAVKQVDSAKIARMRELGGPDELLKTLGDAQRRLTTFVPDLEESEDGLPALPVAKKSAKRSKATAVKLTKSTTAAASKKPAARPRMNNTIRRTASHESAAAEGDESSPEPTPAHLRIGTQGIDLGTMDTSGEDDDDEQADSELDEFIVRSDQPIEMASSSQQLPDDTQPSRREGRTKKSKQAPALADIFSEDGMGSDIDLPDANVNDDDSDEVEEVAAPQPAAVPGSRRKKRVIDDTDSE